MPGSGKRTIHETREQIAALVHSSRSEAERARLEMMVLFLENPKRTFSEMAARIGVSERTLKRWWQTYSDEGLEGLIGRSTDVAQPAAHEQATESGSRANGAPIMPEHVIAFLNALPPMGDATDWPLRYRDALLRLLPDVDHLSVAVNMSCDLTTAGDYHPGVVISQHLGSMPSRLMANRDTAAEETGRRLFDSFVSQGFPVQRYHHPKTFVYHLDDGSYLGAIILWRERERPPVGSATLDLVTRLHPFLEFLLSDLVARFRYSEPVSASYIEAIEELARSTGLTPPEQQVVIMLAEGYSQKMMAEHLMISTHTVQAHMKSVYRKAGVHSATELIARYLTPGRERERTRSGRLKKGTRPNGK